jgi:hypothetical protein
MATVVALAAASVLVGVTTPAGAASPPATAAPAGTLDGRSRLTVDLPDDAQAPGSVTVTVSGADQVAQVVPMLSDRTAMVVVVDASDGGAPQLQPGLSGVANLVLTVPPRARSALVADTDPPVVVAPLAVGPSGALRGLSVVHPQGARQTAAALDLALQQLRPEPDDPRLVVLYTTATDAGGLPAADLAARLAAAGAVLAVVSPAPEVPPYWVAATAATGGAAVPARSGVIAAFDELAATERTCYLVTFPRPEVLPAMVVVRSDTPQGPVTADAVVARPAAAAGSIAASSGGAGWTAGAIGLIVLVAAVPAWIAVRRTRRRGGTDPTGAAWNVPGRDEDAAPRDRLLTVMRAAVRNGGIAVLRPDGMAGLGVTSAMIQFVDRWRDDYDIAWWVPAADPPLVADRLAELGETLGLAVPTDSAEEATDRVLAALRRRGRWLLVLDDAGSRRQLARFLPGGLGHVLVASDDPAWDGHATAVAVDRFDRDESVAVLRSRCPALPAVEADRVAAALDDVPHAVDVAGATLAETGMTVETFLRTLTEHDAAARGVAAAVCSIALDQLAGGDPDAWNLVATLAWLGPDPVPLSLLADPRTTGDTAQLADLAAVAHRRGLARVDGDAVQMHPTPAGVVVGRGGNSDRAAAAVRLLRAAAPADPQSPTWRTLLPHVLAATDPARRLDDVVLEVGWLLHSAGSYLRARGEARAAQALFEDAHDLYRRRLGPDHPDTLAAARTIRSTPVPDRRR